MRRRHPLVERPGTAELSNLLPHERESRLVLSLVHCASNQTGDAAHVRLVETARGKGRGSKPYPTGDEGTLLVEGNHVLVDRDTDLVEQGFDILADETGQTQIDQQEMGIGGAGEQ